MAISTACFNRRGFIAVIVAVQPVICFHLVVRVGDMIISPIDTISAEKRTNASWAAIRGAHKISKKNNQSTRGNTSGLIYLRSYADVAAAPTQ